MKKLDIALLITAVLAVALAGVMMFIPTAKAPGDGPALAGDMRSFNLAKRQFPKFDLKWQDAESRTVRLADFGGKVVLLNFWASWCAPCRKELPSIDRLQARLGGKDFIAIALNNDAGGLPVAARAAKRLGVENLTLYHDPGEAMTNALGIEGLPTTLLFDRTGNLLGTYVGAADWDSADAVSLIRYFIERPDWAKGLKGAS